MGDRSGAAPPAQPTLEHACRVYSGTAGFELQGLPSLRSALARLWGCMQGDEQEGGGHAAAEVSLRRGANVV